MKLLTNIFLAVLVLATLSCDTEQDSPKGADHDFYITGINKSLSYTFSPSNGRQSQAIPEDVRNLTVMILDDDDNIVYEQRYYNYSYYWEYEDSLDASGYDYYYYENTIPDTLFIPSLEEGNYTILTATADFYHYYSYSGWGNPEGAGTPKIESWVTSEGPIYAGKAELELSEDEQEVVMEMTNISSKITLKREGSFDNDGWLEVIIQTEDAVEYWLDDEEFVTPEYDYSESVYGYIDYRSSVNLFTLPKKLTAVQIYYYDYQTGATISQTVEIDPSIELGVGDAITFTINVEDILSGSGRGIFDWNDVSWNDLGEINVP